ncbi:MAG: cytochrome c biogenesis protein DipZ [bacterium]|nr:cytochrome c biogenesis protein DipZ [bacterium]
MLILLFFSFLSGLATVFAPCIWPLLPIILSSSVTNAKRKPLGITLGIMISFALFTLTISYFVKLFNFDPNSLRLIAVIVIGFLGLMLAVPILSRILEGFVSRISGSFGISNSSNGFWGGLIAGFSLGIVWSPCAGPILATIATLAATRTVNLGIVFVTLSYVIGLGIPLFIFATLGSHLFTKTRFLSKYTGRVQQIFGIIMILIAILIYTNYDKVIQIKLLDAFPSYSNFLYKLESSKSVQEQLDKLKNIKDETKKSMPEKSGLTSFGNAPEFAGINNWLNTDKLLKLSDLRGKVVLIDFWTYTCINCIRTLPFVTSWYEKYKDQGFVVVGVHTPEFEFEKKTENVEQAIKQYNIHYPVAQDNDYATWNAYSNQYWPAHYLVDAQGVIRKVHFGEGKYEETEKAIQELLKEAGNSIFEEMVQVMDQTPRERYSPETYLGSNRMQYYYPNGRLSNSKQTFSLSKNISQNSFSLGGEWTIDRDNSVAGQNAVLEYNFFAQKVFLVLRPPASSVGQMKVFLDGKLVSIFSEGTDVKDGIVTIDNDRLYNFIQLKNPENHLLRLEFSPGIEVFAFTFG